MGTLTNAASLNRLTQLKTLFITNLFGMTSADCLLPANAKHLESLGLHNIPADYAIAMKKAWRPEIPNGTHIEITGARKPDWVAENRNNPLREWDGRDHISSVRYRRSLAQYKSTRRAIRAVLADDAIADKAAALRQLGQQFGEAFNALDGTRNPFIETEEREELFAALDFILEEAAADIGDVSTATREQLHAGVESIRSW